jgi:hypothetical protein
LHREQYHPCEHAGQPIQIEGLEGLWICDHQPVVVGSIVGPVSMCSTFGEFDCRLLRGLLETAGVGTNLGTTTLALKEVRAFWQGDDPPEDWSGIPWIASLPPKGLEVLQVDGGRQLLLDAVRRCFAALFCHLLSLLACACASGAWQSIVGDVATLAERLQFNCRKVGRWFR